MMVGRDVNCREGGGLHLSRLPPREVCFSPRIKGVSTIMSAKKGLNGWRKKRNRWEDDRLVSELEIARLIPFHRNKLSGEALGWC